MGCLMCKHVAVSHIFPFAMSAWIQILASVNFYVYSEFFGKSKSLAAHFTDESFPLMFQLMFVTSICRFIAFRTMLTQKPMVRMFSFNMNVK